MIALIVAASVAGLLVVVGAVLILGKRPAERSVARHVQAALSPRAGEDAERATSGDRSVG